MIRYRIDTPFDIMGDSVEKLTAQIFRAMASASAHKLEAEKARVDALNVFPVPDGDTGTNMALTLWSAVDAVLKSTSNSLGELAEAAAQGALLGARGNSGVILSQFLRGFADGVQNLDEADAQQLAIAFVKAAEAAYGAVIRPVEGTVLTVGKEAAQAALRLAQDGEDLFAVLQGALAVAIETLDRTPDILITLREAGVVDAGGEGLVVAARGAFEAINGKHVDLPESRTPVEAPALNNPTESSVNQPEKVGESSITFMYCTEFLVHGTDLKKSDLQQAIEDLGDSTLVVGQPNLMKIHIHTNHPGLVLEICGSRGELSAIHIDNMAEQSKEKEAAQTTKVPSAAETPPAPSIRPTAPAAEVAVVAVSSGDGCIELLHSLGVSKVVHGGQTMNPSTAQLLAAVKETGAKSTIILPNNGNVLMTARQVAHLINTPVIVVPTRSFCEGVAAMLQFSPLDTAADNARRMEEAISLITCGEVTIAVRDARIEGREIKEGQHLGISQGKILTAGPDRQQALLELLSSIITDDSSLVTLYYGAEVDETDANSAAEEVEQRFKLEVETYAGGQPLYSYLVSVE
jgi:DAK2 domain fusion protein YloV